MATLSELRNVRLDKIEKLKNLGVNPYPAKATRTHTNKDILENFEKLENTTVTVTGRVFSIRSHGKLSFFDIKDESAKLQLYIKSENLLNPNYLDSELGFEDLGLLDVGDFIEAHGVITKTQRGEVSILVNKFRLLSKSLRPLPDTWDGFKDIEERYRKRYIDFLINEETKKIIDKRWIIEQEIRKFLWNENFVEVETPILQPLYGGTNAKPFVTHFNALDCDFYLRVAPELYLKRLIVGGYERVFEIARNFRNEGIDHSHFPEFTMIEWYEAYADYHRIMDLAEALTKHLVNKINGSTSLQVKEHNIDVGGKWPRVTVDELLEKHLGIKWETASDEEVKKVQNEHKIHVRGKWTKNKALFAIYDHLITPKLVQPTWVIDYPIDVSPLSKTHRSKPGRAERFEGYIGGTEIFDGWTEIISGLEQRDRFEKEQLNMKEGDTEAMPLDEEFLEALEYGCPPLGGIGFGIDRLTMFLTNTWAIKDVVAFPILKPRTQDQLDQLEDKNQNENQEVEEAIDTQEEENGNEITTTIAINILEENMENKNLQRHCIGVGKTLAKFYDYYKSKNINTGGLSRDEWEAVGILHDADWEKTKDTPEKHTLKTLEWLEKYQPKKEFLNVIKSHNSKITKLKGPQTLLEWTLECIDELTGFIVATALVMPSKKLADVTSEAVLKKFKQKDFAKAVDRSQMEQSEERINVPLKDLVEITLEAMQENSDLLGL